MIKKQKGSKDQSISESIEPEQVYSNGTVVASTKKYPNWNKIFNTGAHIFL